MPLAVGRRPFVLAHHPAPLGFRDIDKQRVTATP